MKLMVNGQMNPESGIVDFVQDGDLNQSLGHYCLQILEDHEEAFEELQAETLSDNLDIKICSELSNYC
ncbi:Protein seele, partial [Eumeta japonica]